VTNTLNDSYTCFDGFRRIASGSLSANALAAKHALEGGAAGPVLIFDDVTGRSIDVYTRGSDEEVMVRLTSAAAAGGCAESAGTERPAQPVAPQVSPDATADGPRGRGRPKLGVVPREVTLLPRHWEWLATQPGGASVALRKLVEEARRVYAEKDRTRKAQERAYHFMSAIAGDLPDFEEATRALFANDRAKFSELIATWPRDVCDHSIALAYGDGAQVPSANN